MLIALYALVILVALLTLPLTRILNQYVKHIIENEASLSETISFLAGYLCSLAYIVVASFYMHHIGHNNLIPLFLIPTFISIVSMIARKGDAARRPTTTVANKTRITK